MSRRKRPGKRERQRLREQEQRQRQARNRQAFYTNPPPVNP